MFTSEYVSESSTIIINIIITTLVAMYFSEGVSMRFLMLIVNE